MSRIDITDPEELPRIAASLTRTNATILTVCQAALNDAQRAEQDAKALVARIESHVAGLRARAAQERDDRARAYLLAKARTAESHLRRAQMIVRSIHGQIQSQQQLCSGYGLRQSAHLSGLSRVHNQIARDLEQAAAILSGRQAGPAPAVLAPIAATAGVSADAPSPNLAAHGMTLVPVAGLDIGIEHVRGPMDFHKMSMADMQASLELMRDVVLPQVGQGAGLAEMQALDQRSGLADAPVNHARTFGLFFGDDRIRVSEDRSGALSITNGAHRIWLANRCGFTQLPMEVRKPS